jgi:hypothetical protein
MRDGNKDRREMERRILHKSGWKAVPALKRNGAFVWRWIHRTRKKAYTREQAVSIVSNAR